MARDLLPQSSCEPQVLLTQHLPSAGGQAGSKREVLCCGQHHNGILQHLSVQAALRQQAPCRVQLQCTTTVRSTFASSPRRRASLADTASRACAGASQLRGPGHRAWQTHWG